MATQPPPSTVLAAFGIGGTPVLLEGGQRPSWRVGDAVLKPLDLEEPELAWQAEVFASISCHGFRVAHPLQAGNGELVVAGWCAWEAVEGRRESRRWAEIIAAGERFHAALAGIPCPDFLSRRTDPWAVRDRVAWGDVPADMVAQVEHLRRLAARLKPLATPSQLIQGDLSGNGLFDDQLPPAVIDFSPYWRPAAFAAAIVVADALVWEGAREDILDAVAHIEHFEQYFLRALIYRAVSDRLFRLHERHSPDDADPYLSAVELACPLAA